MTVSMQLSMDLPTFEDLNRTACGTACGTAETAPVPVRAETARQRKASSEKVKSFLEKKKQGSVASGSEAPGSGAPGSSAPNPRIKFQQFKLCFPEETKTFKPLAKNATEEEWKELFEEIDTVISCKGLQDYLENLIIAGVQGLEAWFDADGNFDMRGASLILQNNPEFRTVCKRLYLKYNLFKASPPEMQLIIIVATACMTAAKKNQARRHLGQILTSGSGGADAEEHKRDLSVN